VLRVRGGRRGGGRGVRERGEGGEFPCESETGETDQTGAHGSDRSCRCRTLLRLRRRHHISAKDILPEPRRVVSIVAPHGNVWSEEAILNPSEVSLVEVGFENVRLDDEDVSELAEHFEAVVQGGEGEGREGVLVEG
jgi:hypothetical protein